MITLGSGGRGLLPESVRSYRPNGELGILMPLTRKMGDQL